MRSGYAWNPDSPGWNTAFTTLVVDRELPFDGVLDEFIRKKGHFVLRARSYAEALVKASEFRPHVILLNGDLENGARLEILAGLLRRDSAAGVVFMTRKPSIPEAVEAIRIGAVDYLGLPPDPERLTQVIISQMDALRAA